jgi:mannosyltransferase
MTSPSGSPRAGQAAAGDLQMAPGPGDRPVLPGQPALNGSGPVPAGAGRGYDPGPAWARYLPPVVALGLSLWGITTPSLWRDEAATVAAVRRPLGDLVEMLGNVDAVHSAYYLAMWPLVHLLGAGEFVLRAPSALATAATAAIVAAIGRRLISPWAGLAAGLIFATLPVASRYGQEARPYAGVVLAAALASYLLLRLLSEDAPRRRWLAGYAASLAALGVANIFGLLLIGAHALTVALHYRRRARDPVARRVGLAWLIAAAAGAACASPLLVLGFRQRDQIAWLAVNRSSSGLGTTLQLPGSILVTGPIVLTIAVALVLAFELSPERRRAAWPFPLAELCLPWLLLPPLVLFAASPVVHVYTTRYILMCLPALTLLAGAAAAALGRIAGPIAVAVIIAVGLPAQFNIRLPYGHYDDIRYLDWVVTGHARPGDAVLYTNPNSDSFGAAYPAGLGTLPDVARQRAAIPSGTLAGTQAPLATIRARLRNVSRVWVVEINDCTITPQVDGLNGLPLEPGQSAGQSVLAGLPLHIAGVWHEPHSGDWLVLYAHGSGPQYFVCPPH